MLWGGLFVFSALQFAASRQTANAKEPPFPCEARQFFEQVFRGNNRATKQHFIGDGDRYQMAMQHFANRRLTYEELTGKGTDSVHS